MCRNSLLEKQLDDDVWQGFYYVLVLNVSPLKLSSAKTCFNVFCCAMLDLAQPALSNWLHGWKVERTVSWKEDIWQLYLNFSSDDEKNCQLCSLHS